MIFAASTDDRTLMAFKTEADAVSYCEGIDVEEGGWLFWDSTGDPLEADFLVPNTRGWFSVRSGTYRLIAASGTVRAPLLEALNEIALFEGQPPLDSADGVRQHLLQQHASAPTEQEMEGGRGEI